MIYVNLLKYKSTNHVTSYSYFWLRADGDQEQDRNKQRNQSNLFVQFLANGAQLDKLKDA